MIRAGAGERGALAAARSTRSRRTAPARRSAIRSRRRRCSRPTGRSGTDGPLWLGSIKSNIGHTQAAGGVAGVIKMVHGACGTACCRRRCTWTSPRTRWTGRRATCAADRAGAVAARRASAPRRGLLVRHQRHQRARDPGGGPPPARSARAARTRSEPRRRPAVLPWLVSGSGSETALRRPGASACWTHLEARLELEPARRGRLAGHRTRALEQRAAVVAGRRARSCCAGLDGAGSQGEPAAAASCRGPRRRRAGRRSCSPARAPSARDGRGALRGPSRCSAQALDEVCAELDRAPGGARLRRTVRLHLGAAGIVFAAEGSPEAALLDQTAFTQAALFALEVALFRLSESLGRAPGLPDRAFDRGAGRGACGGGVLARGRLHAGRGARTLDGGAAGGRGDGRARGHRGGGRADASGLEGRRVALAAVNGPRAVVSPATPMRWRSCR